MSDSDLVLLRSYRYEYEARVAHDTLHAAGIPSLVSGEVLGPELATITSVDLLVRPDDLERARAALDSSPIAR